MSDLPVEWSKLIAAPKDTHVNEILEYCQSYIDKQKSGEISEENVGYAICGILGVQINIPTTFEPLIDLACDLEIGRDSQYFFGIGTWNQKEADQKKEKQYTAFLQLYEKLKVEYSEKG